MQYLVCSGSGSLINLPLSFLTLLCEADLVQVFTDPCKEDLEVSGEVGCWWGACKIGLEVLTDPRFPREGELMEVTGPRENC